MTHKKILFANAPFDGHFNPLVPLALHLKSQGHDVRWYSGSIYQSRVEKHGIPFYPCEEALDLNQENLNHLLPERIKITSQVKKLKYDLKHVFILRSVEYFEDIKRINREFDFDIMIADVGFTAVPFVKTKLKKLVVTIGVFPLPQSSVDLPPNGLGLTPAKSQLGRLRQHIMRYIIDKLVFGESKSIASGLFRKYRMVPPKGNIFDLLCNEASLVLQSGTPGFEYYRSDLGKNIRFIGPLLPIKKKSATDVSFKASTQFKTRILITQGTVEKDPAKLIIPAIEAFKNDPTIQLIITTGGAATDVLRSRYARENIIIEDFIAFDEVMPTTDVFITNGGYGGVLLAIANKVPMVVAGLNEGKNEICARVGYFNLGRNLKTETPTVRELQEAVTTVIKDPVYKQSIERLKAEFDQYNPYELIDKHMEELVAATEIKKQPRQYGLFELEAA